MFSPKKSSIRGACFGRQGESKKRDSLRQIMRAGCQYLRMTVRTVLRTQRLSASPKIPVPQAWDGQQRAFRVRTPLRDHAGWDTGHHRDDQEKQMNHDQMNVRNLGICNSLELWDNLEVIESIFTKWLSHLPRRTEA